MTTVAICRLSQHKSRRLHPSRRHIQCKKMVGEDKSFRQHAAIKFLVKFFRNITQFYSFAARGALAVVSVAHFVSNERVQLNYNA
jgi:hypothetical protein